MERRRVCSFCCQELGRTAFYRHFSDKTGNVCPGKKKPRSTGRSLHRETEDAYDVCDSIEGDSELHLSSGSPRALDSTFDLDSSDEGEQMNHSLGLPNTGEITSSSSDSDASSSGSSSDGEIWEDTDDEDGNSAENLSTQVKTIISGLSFFLVFYHLLFRLSERAITTLLGFFGVLFSFLSSVTGHRLLTEVSSALPKTMHSFRAKFKPCNYIEYVVCPKCNTLYTFSDCIVINSGQQESKLCHFVRFPNHPHRSRRSSCNEVLLKRVKVGGNYKLVPRKVYVYRSVVETLKQFALRPGFLEKCEHWRTRQSTCVDNVLGDVYDGKLWKELFVINGMPFLSVPNNLCLALNVDWFNPYEETNYSVGAIYLVVLNLPRNERYKEENTILVGMIPGPSEPKDHINTFLSPLVQDMQTLFDGVAFHSPAIGSFTIRATLACITCDLPATRKVCGFSNFNGTHGCSKCMKEFVTQDFGDKPLCNGFDCSTWMPRSNDMHKRKATEFQQARTASECKRILHQWGVKHSELLLLPHFDMVRCHVIDPMHCVFLGLAKHTIKTWKELGVLEDNHFSMLQEKVDSIVPPSKIGRIPRKIESKFSSFTADEWKNWILYYSIFALYKVIGEAHYKCWSFLVDSCLILCQPVITTTQIDHAHILLIEYCKLFETLYGPEHCTPNMHMSCHLRECMLDYGPFSSFWCFPYERYNGILEGISKSWIAPEKQMFLKFLGMQNLKQLCARTDTNEDFLSLVYKLIQPKEKLDSSSLGQTSWQDIISMQQLRNVSCSVQDIDAVKSTYQCLIPPFKEKYFRDYELSYLQDMYSLLYPTSHIANISRCYREYKKCTVNGEEFISHYSSSQRSCAIAAKWCGVIGINSDGEAPLRIGQIISFIEHEITLSPGEIGTYTSGSVKRHILIRLQWYGDHPHRDYIHSSVVICSSIFDDDSPASFMPISRIMCRCAVSSPQSFKFDFGYDRIVIAVPLIKFIEYDHE